MFPATSERLGFILMIVGMLEPLDDTSCASGRERRPEACRLPAFMREEAARRLLGRRWKLAET
jgi:hypothetical protein